MATFRLYQLDCGLYYYYFKRPVSYGSGWCVGSDNTPRTLTADCFYRAFVTLWPNSFDPRLVPAGPFDFIYLSEDERNSDTVRVYSWEGATFFVEKVAD